MSQVLLLKKYRPANDSVETADSVKWDESKHPRKGGKFAPKGTGTTGKTGGTTGSVGRKPAKYNSKKTASGMSHKEFKSAMESCRTGFNNAIKNFNAARKSKDAKKMKGAMEDMRRFESELRSALTKRPDGISKEHWADFKEQGGDWAHNMKLTLKNIALEKSGAYVKGGYKSHPLIAK